MNKIKLTSIKYIRNIAKSYYHRFDSDNNRIEIKWFDGIERKAIFYLHVNREFELELVLKADIDGRNIYIDDSSIDKFINNLFSRSKKLKRLVRYIWDLMRSPKGYISGDGTVRYW